MPVKNGYAAMVRKKSRRNIYKVMVEGNRQKSKRRKLDDYETPESATKALTDHIEFTGAILEPAAGSGRMAKVLRRETKRQVFTSDIKRGRDFLKRNDKFKGNIITNPPYGRKLDAFAEKALELATGRVALLVEGKWLWGSKRANGLFKKFPPETVIVLSSRIYFYEGSGKPIPAQFFSHCWVVWPTQFNREHQKHATKLVIMDQNQYDS